MIQHTIQKGIVRVLRCTFIQILPSLKKVGRYWPETPRLEMGPTPALHVTTSWL